MSTTEDRLHQIIDDRFTRMYISLEEYIKRLQAQVAQGSSDHYGPTVTDLQTRLQSAEQLFRETEERASAMASELIKKETALAKMIDLSGRLHEKCRNRDARFHGFNEWLDMATHQSIAVRVFRSIFLGPASKRLYFRRWHRKTLVKQENRLAAEIKVSFEEKSCEKRVETDRLINDLETSLAIARHELQTKQQNYIEMQQRLRKAFMRGLVNLNLEAMDVFRGQEELAFLLAPDALAQDRHQHPYPAPIDDLEDDCIVQEDNPRILVQRH
jgi:cell division septum initiation protein DivIVA